MELIKEEKEYYINRLQEAISIVKEACGGLNTSLVSTVFDKIAVDIVELRREQAGSKRDGVKKATGIMSGKKNDDSAGNAGVVKLNDGVKGEETQVGKIDAKDVFDVIAKLETPRYREDGQMAVADLLDDDIVISGIEKSEDDTDPAYFISTSKGVVKTYSKVLIGQIQHLDDKGLLPVKGKIVRRESSRSHKNYYTFIKYHASSLNPKRGECLPGYL